MRSGYARGFGLVKTPNARTQAQRRRLAVLCAVVGLALASGVVGSLTAPRTPASSDPAPFSYYPHE